MTPSEKALQDIENMIAANEASYDQNRAAITELETQIYALREAGAAIRNRRSELNVEKIKAEAKVLREKQEAESRAIDFEKIGAYITKAKELTPDLLDFQVEDVAFYFDRIYSEGKFRGVLNANAMGLGKTVTTAAVLKVTGGNGLWLTKKALVKSTAAECKRWGLSLLPLTGQGPQKGAMLQFAQSLPAVNIITNYETLNTNTDDIMAIKWDFVVIDEVHRLKGGANAYPTNIWKNTKELLEQQPDAFPIFLTGSPIQNKMSEVWAYLHLFDPIRFPTKRKFEQMFDMNWGADRQKLLSALAPNMIRRRKDEVGIQLPPKNYQRHEIEMPEGSEFKQRYKELSDKMFAEFPEGNISVANMLAHLHYLRTIALAPGKIKVREQEIDPETLTIVDKFVTKDLTFKPSYPKLDYCFELVCELLEDEEAEAKANDTVPGGVVIWSASFNAPINYLKELFSNVGYKVGVIKGDTPNAGEVERQFQQGEIQILICNLKSAAEGFNFQRSDKWPGGASHAIFLDYWFNPALNEQAEDRIWRTGTRMPVTIHSLILEDSVDQFIEALVDSKKAMAGQIMEDSALRPGSDWKGMLKKYLG